MCFDVNFIQIEFCFFNLTHKIFLFIHRNHEWFKKDLPEYLFPLVNENEASVIDADAVAEVCEVSKMGTYFNNYS